MEQVAASDLNEAKSSSCSKGQTLLLGCYGLAVFFCVDTSFPCVHMVSTDKAATDLKAFLIG